MSIASRITSMENNIRNAYHGLDSIGIDTTNTNKNIENISALLEDFYDSLPKVSGSGTNISLSPTKIGRITSQINGDTQQNGTPTPDSPVAIETVTRLQNVSVKGKNLINMVETNKSVNSQGNISSSNIIYLGVEDYIPVQPNTTYTITFQHDIVVDGGIANLYIGKKDKDGNFIERTSYYTNRTFTTDANTYYIFPYLNKSGFEFTTIGGYVQLEYGSTATEYEPYQGKDYEINLGTIELNKIGTYQDKIYKQNDTWYIEKQIGKVVLDGSENWAKIQIGTTGKYYYQRNPRPVLGQQTANGKLVLSNYFKATNTWSEIVVGIWLDANMIIKTEGSLDGTETVEDFKTWLSTHNTTVYYVLETPTYEEITNETLITQLENWYYAMSKNGQTNISVEGDLPMILDVSALKGE